MLTLYTHPRSANGRKPLAVCRHLGLAPEIRLVDVYRGEGRTVEYLAIDPAGRIPALVEDELVLHESNAIMLYLCEAHGDGRLWPAAPLERARIARWLFWEAAHWQPALTAVLSACVGHRLLPDVVPAPERPPDWQDPRLAPLLAGLERSLADRTWLEGDAPSLADFGVAAMTTYFRCGAFPSDAFPAIRGWLERLDALDAWRASADPLWR